MATPSTHPTQDTLARNLNVKQAEISKIENRAEW
jgi:DNA-binding XRE family transcriptional regulator